MSAGATGLERRRRGAPFRIGDFRVEPGLDRLFGPHGEVALEPRAMDLLLYLAERAGETVSKEEILGEVWSGAAVVEAVVPKAVFALRQAFGDEAGEPRYILTVQRRGYRLLAPVTSAGPPAATPWEAHEAPADPPLAGASRDAAAAPPGSREPASARPSRARWSRGATAAVLAAAGLLALGLAVRARRFAPANPPPEPPLALDPSIASPTVERVVLEARRLWSTRRHADLVRALELLERAATEAPSSAEVRGWLAIATVTESNYVGAAPEALARAEHEADEALRLDSASAVAHAAKGLVALNRRISVAEAVAEQRRAVALDPRLVVAKQYLAEALSAAGQHEEAIAEIEEAERLEPLSPLVHGVHGLVLLCADRPLAALEAFDRVLVLAPEFSWFHRYRGYALARLGRTDEAVRALEEEVRAVGEKPEALADLRERIDRSGLDGYWSWLLARLEFVERSGMVPRPTQLAEALAGVGRYDEALAALRRAPAAGDGEYFLYFKESPAFDSLRSDPEFMAIYRRQ